MPLDRIDRALAERHDVVPSAGFVEQTMNRVRAEASAPPPLAFPWPLALPGIAGLAFVIARLLTGTASIPADVTVPRMPVVLEPLMNAAGAVGGRDFYWVTAATLLTCAIVAWGPKAFRRSTTLFA
jgi:hypothetical protein